jgi:hypothetical protein
MMHQEQNVTLTKRLFMQTKNGIIVVLSVIILVLLFPMAASFFEGNNKPEHMVKVLSLDDYEVGTMIETGDFLLLNRKSNTIDYCIKDSLNKTIHLQIMRMEQMSYNQYFDNKKEKK